jgi:hypothetical protein
VSKSDSRFFGTKNSKRSIQSSDGDDPVPEAGDRSTEKSFFPAGRALGST